ncbi:MAG: Asp23/Gls24 family envelope stress response protein [Bacilli bacterium]|nr:Asp23/Gls24 family envelope stress response protein [Bacilli bacterium]NLN79885.1 Asp23/Gls24 family envelope stress response protein [Erysipelotrichia bacterium]
MTIDKTTPYGDINISLEAIATIAGNAAMECYGVVGLASKSSIRENIAELLKADNYAKAVTVIKEKDKYEVNVYIVVAYGLKITEVVSQVQKRVKYVLEKTFNLKFKAINVYVQSLKAIT